MPCNEINYRFIIINFQFVNIEATSKARNAVFFRFGAGWPQFYGRSKQVIEESK